VRSVQIIRSGAPHRPHEREIMSQSRKALPTASVTYRQVITSDISSKSRLAAAQFWRWLSPNGEDDTGKCSYREGEPSQQV
jgi:hypothetical protein